jgi:alpha-L-rhamnosidase
MRAVALRTNARSDPFGIDTVEPIFSWRWLAESVSYRIQVSATDDFASPVWDSGVVVDGTPYGVRYDGERLRSRTRYWWRVSSGDGLSWSAPAKFETAFLAPEVPHAQWIGAPQPALDDEQALYLNNRLTLASPVVHARLYASALGWYRFFINGRDVTEGAQVPRWTPLGEVVEYQTYDVTTDLVAGENALAMVVGDGRYRGYLGGERRRKRFGDRLAGFARFEIELEDGTSVSLATDSAWFAGQGRIRASDPQAGERVDLRLTDDAWLAGNPAALVAAESLPPAPRTLIAEEVDRVREVGRLSGTVSTSPGGKQLVDFGQNITGFVRVKLTGGVGTEVTITHSELLTPDGELDESYLWNAQAKNWWQRDKVTLDGSETWYQPWFAIRGFRYVEIDGIDRALVSDDIEAIVMSTDLPRTGNFECSHPGLNKLYENVVWSMRGNFVDTPTDCPTRERAGWTGDAQVFAPTATHLMDVQAYFARYLSNLSIDQLDDGTVPPFIPNQDPKGTRHSGIGGWAERQLPKSTGWGDASVLIPWAMYQAYDDLSVLRNSYASMTKWVGYLEREAATKRGRARWFARRLGRHDRYIIGSGHQFGEWLRPDDGVRQLLQVAFAPAAVVATAYFAHSTQMVSTIAALLGKDTDVRRYAALADKVRKAWRAAFVRNGGSRIGEDKQDDYVRALAFKLLEPEQRALAFNRLLELIDEVNDHLGTGFLSTPMLLAVLTEGGRTDVAYRLITQTTSPSWLYQVGAGATTVWETWDGFTPDGKGKNSHNHYSFGAVASWLVETVAGISPAEPGYRRIRIAPVVGGGLTHARATQLTPFGIVESSWQLDGDRVRLGIVVPPGTTAEVCIDGRQHTVEPGEHRFDWLHHERK